MDQDDRLASQVPGPLPGPLPGTGRHSWRQSQGSAWHWKQTDCWYCTIPGARQRVPLFDEGGQRIRGKENRESGCLALARVKLSDELQPPPNRDQGEWNVARVCDIYLVHLHDTAGSMICAATVEL